MSFQLDGPTLEGVMVRLEPLSQRHAADLAVAAEEDRSSYDLTVVPTAITIQEYIDMQLSRAATGGMVPYAQIQLSSGRAVGATAYWNPRFWPDREEVCAIEIGWTWLSASSQGAGVNSEAKLLLLQYAFEHWGVVRVDMKTDARNLHCQAALKGIGAQFEGILRSWSPSRKLGEEGKLRDSAMYSVLLSEWPTCRRHIEERMAKRLRK